MNPQKMERREVRVARREGRQQERTENVSFLTRFALEMRAESAEAGEDQSPDAKVVGPLRAAAAALELAAARIESKDQR